MSGIGDIFSRGLDGLNVNQRGLAVTANNIANMNTKGYARQSISIGHNAAGGGASVLGVNSITSPFVELQLFNTANSFGTVDGRRRTVAQTEELFNESTNDGIGKAMNAFFNSFSSLSGDASDITKRQNVRDTAQRLVSKLNSVQLQLNQMRSDISSEVSSRVTTINDLAAQIAELNGQIQGNPNPDSVLDLKSQRMNVLRDLSEEINVSYFEQGDVMQVSINGSVNFVNGILSGSLSMTNDLNLGGTMGVQVTLPGGNSTLDITHQVTGGRLGGNLIERNTTLNDRLDELDELAFAIVQQVNAVHSAGYDLDGNTGVNFFQPLASASGAARNIQINAAILATPRSIAAAQQDPSVSGVGDGRVSQLLANLQDTSTMSAGSQTFQQFYQGIVGTVGSTARSVSQDYNTQEGLVNHLQIQRESISGVNLDEEGANIIRYQRAYQAASRMVSVADQLLDTLLKI